MPIQAADYVLDSYFKCALANDELILPCKAYRVGTLDSNSPEKPHPVKIELGSVEEKKNSTQPRKEVTFCNARALSSPEL